jgi:hypothetical protein
VEPSDDQVSRARANEERFAAANREIAGLAGGFEVERVPFLCECSDPGCTAVVQLRPVDYEAAKRGRDLFVLLRGHEDPAVERVIAADDGFMVVEKRDVGNA